MSTTRGLLNFGTTAIPSGSDLHSQVLILDPWVGYSVQIFWTGTPTGTWIIEGSNDNETYQPDGTLTGVVNWDTVANSSQATGGTSGSFVVNYEGSFYRHIRVTYSHTSGTGTITSATYSLKVTA